MMMTDIFEISPLSANMNDPTDVGQKIKMLRLVSTKKKQKTDFGENFKKSKPEKIIFS